METRILHNFPQVPWVFNVWMENLKTRVEKCLFKILIGRYIMVYASLVVTLSEGLNNIMELMASSDNGLK